MFSKFGSKETGSSNIVKSPATGAAQPKLQPEVSASKPEAPKPKPKPNLSVIGKSVELKGDLVAAEDLLIQGRLEGSVSNKSQNLVIGTDGTVEAAVAGKSVTVKGTVNGDIHGSESVIIESSARVEGNISSSSIGVEKGAKFKGSIDTFGDATKDSGRISNEAVDKILDS
ncbi:MAG: polymer-forming cytoskeletal protein [Gammaproteobacteria bacterium]|jgi:cytoskeletal protein CcmA (bactofilin family)